MTHSSPAARLLTLLVILAVLLAGFGSSLFPPAIARAQALPSGITLTARAGFGNNFKPNTWIPVFVHIENTTASPSAGYVQIQFVDASNANIYQYPLDLPAGAQKELSLLAFTPAYGFEIEVAYFVKQPTSILDRKAVVTISANSRSVDDQLIGVLASAPSAFNPLSLLKPINGDAIMIDLNLQDLPETSLALSSLKMLVFADFDTSALSARQSAALVSWVQSGGRLVICGGAGWQKTSAGLAALLAVQPTGLQNNADWGSLDSLVTASDVYIANPVEIKNLAGSAMLAAVPNPTPENQDDLPGSWAPTVLAWAGSSPLAVRQQVGHGEVLFLAFDPQKPPFRSWEGMEFLYKIWLGPALNIPLWANGFSDWNNATYAAETVPNLTVPPIVLVCGFLFVYMLLIGPVNFLVLRRLKRPELAWVTIPGMVVIFSLVILVSGGLTRSRLPILNRLAVVQVWPNANAAARFDGVVGIYSPYRATYQVDFASGGLPHLMPANSTSSLSRLDFQQTGSGFQAANFMADVNGITSLAAEGSLPAPAINADLSIEIGGTEARLTGSINNQTTFTLEKAALLTPGGAITLGDLAAGATMSVNEVVPNNAAAVITPTIALPPPGFPGKFAPTSPGSQGQIEAMMGTADFYSDRPTYRRYTLLMAAVQNSYYAISGSGYYLTGWSSQSVLPVSLNAHKTENQDTTFYIIQVQPATRVKSGRLTIPPGLFSVKTIDSTGIYPYNQGYYLYGGEVITLEFALSPALPFKTVQNLTLSLESPEFIQTPVNDIVFSLWDFQEETWVEAQDLIWGDNQIALPGRFVTENGTIRLRLENGNQNYVSINAINVSMVIDR